MSTLVRSRGGSVARVPPLALNDDNNPEVINHSANCFFISAPVAEISELSVGADDRTDLDRLLHRGGDSLQWCAVQRTVLIHIAPEEQMKPANLL